MEVTWYSEKHNTLFINSKYLLPDTKSMGFEERYRANKKAFAMSYPKRLEEFCKDSNIKKQIKEEIKTHKGCKLSEFCNA